MLLLTNTLLKSIFIVASSSYLLYKSICECFNYTKSKIMKGVSLIFFSPKIWQLATYWNILDFDYPAIFWKSVFSHFSIWPTPRGSCFAKIRVSCQTFKIDIERSFFPSPFLTIVKPMEQSEIMFSHQKSVKKAFFPIWPPPGGLIIVLPLPVFSFNFYFFQVDWQTLVLMYVMYQVGSVRIWQVFNCDAWRP